MDVKLLGECLRDVIFPYHLSTVRTGEEALAFLQRQAPYTTAPRPDLILLDIHLPHQSGWDGPARARTVPSLAGISVVMLTGTFSLLRQGRVDQLQPTRC